MTGRVVWMKQELIFWLWHHWFGHGKDTGYQVFAKPGRLDIRVRVCLSCDRVWPEDVLAATDARLADLDETDG